MIKHFVLGMVAVIAPIIGGYLLNYNEVDRMMDHQSTLEVMKGTRAIALNTPSPGTVLQVQFETNLMLKDCDLEVWVYAIGETSVFPLSSVKHPAWFSNFVAGKDIPFQSSFKIPASTPEGLYNAVPTIRYFCNGDNYRNDKDLELPAFSFKVQGGQDVKGTSI